ncbi:MAG: hypothetical protein ACR2N3_05655 [Pyrinomonadaceae bacterium]
MKIKNLLISSSFIFSLLFCMAFVCNNGNDQSAAGDGETPARQTTVSTTDSGIPTGEYAFMSVTSIRRDGSPNVNTNVHGSLVLNDDGTYEHSIYIGNSPGGCGPGTYSIAGDTLRLMPNASTGCNAADWKYIYDAQMNRLSLRDENVTLLYCVAGGKDCFKNGE